MGKAMNIDWENIDERIDPMNNRWVRCLWR